VGWFNHWAHDYWRTIGWNEFWAAVDWVAEVERNTANAAPSEAAEVDVLAAHEARVSRQTGLPGFGDHLAAERARAS